MSPSEANKFNPDLSNIPLRRESVSSMSFRFDKKKEQENKKEDEILSILTKIQKENWNKEIKMEEMMTEIIKIKTLSANILDMNIKLEMEVKSLKDEVRKRKEEDDITGNRNSIVILTEALKEIAKGSINK